jgi:type 1 glutamine amidotransferase
MKKALIVWGGWDGHHPKAMADYAASFLLSQGFEVRIENQLEILSDHAYLEALSLIVPIWTMGKISKEQETGLLGAVRSGVGLAGWHGGAGDAFREAPNYQFMIGGQFVSHPGNMIPYRVNIADRDHAITAGLADFEVRSEQYYLHVDPSNQVLATTTFSGDYDGVSWIRGNVMPVVWTRPWGLGRVFYSALGHQPSEFTVHETAEILRRGLLWAAR